jgi:hypothetical protein
VLTGGNERVAETMKNMPCFQRLAGWQNGEYPKRSAGVLVMFFPAALQSGFPLIYRYAQRRLQTVFDRTSPTTGRQLRRPFANSIYPIFCGNFGLVETYPHRDVGNSPGVPCAITALGNFDPDAGGHLVLYDLKLIIRFPAGCTILLPSASIKHGNIPVSLGDSRTSFTQYCPGGLLRYASWGCRTLKQLPEGTVEKLKRGAQRRFERVLSRFSLMDKLEDDIRHAFGA